MKKLNKKKLLISLLLLTFLVVIMAITLTSCKGPIEGLNSQTIINQIFPNVWVLIGQLISMAILFTVILFFIWKPANKMLEKRRQLIIEELEQGKKMQQEANEKLALAESLQANTKEEAKKLLQEANEKSAAILAEAHEQARLEKEKIINDANSQAQRDVNKLKTDAELEIINTALKTAEFLMKKEISKKDNDKLVREFISKL